MKRKFLSIFCLACIIFCISGINVNAEEVASQNNDDICYVETDIIINEAPSIKKLSGAYSVSTASKTKKVTATKKNTYKNSDGKVLWYVSVTGTFSYNGSTSSCTSCSHSAVSYATTWSITSSSSSRSGNKATATATAKHKGALLSKSYTKTISVQCSKSGKIS